MLFNHRYISGKKNTFPSNCIYTLFFRTQQYQIGSTLVVATAMGFLVIGATGLAIVNASSDKTNTISDEQTKQALAVAEAGVTKMQDLFVKEPRLAMVEDNNQWTDIINVGKDQLQEKLNETIGISEIDQDNSCSVVQGGSSPSDTPLPLTPEEIIEKLQGGVIKIPSNNLDIRKGVDDWVSLGDKKEYRLVNYTHDPTTQKSILVIQGKVGDSNISTSQIEVEFEVTKNNSSGTEEKVPAIWITDSGNDFGNNKISGNVKIYSPTCKTLQEMGQNNNPLLSSDNLVNGGKIYIDKESMVETPTKPNDSILNIATDITNSTTFPLNITDKKDSDGYYHYLVPSVTLSNNKILTIAADTKVVFYLQDDFNIDGNSEIRVNNTSSLQIYGNTHDPINQVSKYGCPENITGCQTNKVLIPSQNATENIFIHTPNATVGINDNGSVNPNFKGSIWAKSWNASNTIAMEASGNYEDYLSGKNRVVLGNPTYKIGNISKWTRQEVFKENN